MTLSKYLFVKYSLLASFCSLSLHAEKILPINWPDLPPENSIARADAALENRFIELGKSSMLPVRKNGHLDWGHQGPDNEPEWAWMNNRMLVLPALVEQWEKTGKSYYLEKVNDLLVNWIRANPYPRARSFSAQWRALETARRVLDSWIPVYQRLKMEPGFSAEARHLLIHSLQDHAHNLRYYATKWGGNHLLTEMTALSAIAITFPEFEKAAQWLSYAEEVFKNEILKQTYPDGSYKELTNLYQRVALQNAQRYIELMHYNGGRVDPLLLKRVEKMWNYYAYVMRPDGKGPLNNASDLEDNVYYLKQVIDFYNRDDWHYIASNGREGTRPDGPPSRYFPYAGHAVLRSGWREYDFWAFFDLGPHGTAHQHHDRFHLSLSEYGQDFLVDSGRYTYQPGRDRAYFTGPDAHNVIILDNESTVPLVSQSHQPLNVLAVITHSHDFFASKSLFPRKPLFGKGHNYHARALYHRRGEYLVILDHVKVYGINRIDALWHFHPDINIQRYFGVVNAASSRISDATLKLIPLVPSNAGYRLVQADNDNEYASWYSSDYNQKVHSSLAVYSLEVFRPIWLAWVIPLLGSKTNPIISSKIEDSLSPQCRIEIIRADGETEILVFSSSAKTGIQLTKNTIIDKP